MSKTETYIAMQSESPDAFQDMLKADLKDVGVARFNQDHLRLLNEFLVLQRVMDDFRQNKISESGWKKADEIIIFLFKYAEEHFGAEEEAMKKANYKDYVSHEAMHSQFRRMLVDYKEVVAARDKKIFLASNMICLIGFLTISTMSTLGIPGLSRPSREGKDGLPFFLNFVQNGRFNGPALRS